MQRLNDDALMTAEKNPPTLRPAGKTNTDDTDTSSSGQFKNERVPPPLPPPTQKKNKKKSDD